MPNSDLIGYNYNALAEGIDQMKTVNKNVEGLIEDLAKNVGNALDNWHGTAADQYNLLAKKLEGDFADLNSVVHDLATELGIRADDMSQQDSRSGNRFGK